MKIKAWQKMFCLVNYCKLTFICAWKFFVRFAWPLSSWIFYAVDQSWNMSSIFVASSSWSQKLVNTNQFIFGRSWNKISKNWYMLITNIYRRLFLLLYFDLFICNLIKIRLRNIWLIGILYCRCLVKFNYIELYIQTQRWFRLYQMWILFPHRQLHVCNMKAQKSCIIRIHVYWNSNSVQVVK